MVQNQIKVVSEFLPNFDEVRQMGIDAEYVDWYSEKDGNTYKRVSIQEIPGVKEGIEKIYGPVEMLGMAFRLNYDGELPNAAIHTDFGWGTHAMVLYLNDGESGTMFWEHAATKTQSISIYDPILKEVEKDWNDQSKWDHLEFVKMVKNRAVFYPSDRYHSRYPFAAFGNNPENGRLIVVAFFTPHSVAFVRKAEEKDLRRIVEMSERYYAETHYAKMYSFNPVAVAEKALLLMQHGFLAVAEVKGEVKGMIGFAVVPYLFNPEGLGAYEVIFYLEPEGRKAQAGSKLIKFAERILKQYNVNYTVLAHLPENDPIVGKMYQRLGYNLTELSYTKVL